MPLFRRRKLKKDIEKKRKYLAYFKAMRAKGRMPLSYVKWLEKDKTTARTRKVTKGLRTAGLTQAEINRLRGK